MSYTTARRLPARPAPTFADRTGRVWRVRLTPDAVATARHAGVYLATAAGSVKALLRLLDRPRHVGVALFAGCEAQLADAGLAPEEFAGLVCVEGVFDRAGEALAAAVAEAFPDTPVGRALAPAAG